MPSPRPIPTNLKIVRGNPGKRPLNKREPKPRAVLPNCPAHLSDEGKREWHRMGRKLLALGVMSEIDKAALATYCQAWGRWVEAEQLLATEGLVTVAPNNGYIMPSPYLSIANKAMEQMMKALIEFGMTPSSRSRIKADTSEKDKDPFEEFLGGRRSAP